MIASLQEARDETQSAYPMDLHRRLRGCRLVLRRWRELAAAAQWSDPRLPAVVEELRRKAQQVQTLLRRARSIHDDPMGLRSLLATSVMGLRDVEMSIRRLTPRFRFAARRLNQTQLSA
jgi:hypothetical protein